MSESPSGSVTVISTLYVPGAAETMPEMVAVPSPLSARPRPLSRPVAEKANVSPGSSGSDAATLKVRTSLY